MSLLKRSIKIVVTWNVILLCLLGTIFVFALLAGFSAASATVEPKTYDTIYGKGSNEFLSIPITGTILGTSDSQGFGGLFGGMSDTYGYDVKDQLIEAAEDPLIQGIILEIDSPGGTIYGAHAIADGVAYYKKTTQKPVYAHIQGMGASGAYWAAASADKIFADYGSAVGSIGVIMGPFEYYDKVVATDGGLLGGGVITQNGIESTYITAGQSKDVGNPFRRLTQQEVSKLQQTVNNEYDSFVEYVSKQRKLSPDVVRNDIGAMVYDPKSALELKLTDATGSRQDAYRELSEAAGKGSDYVITRAYSEPGFVSALFGAVTGRKQPEAKQAKTDYCSLTKVSLAYHGDVTGWCSKSEN